MGNVENEKREKEVFFRVGNEVGIKSFDGRYVEGVINLIEVKQVDEKFVPLLNINITERGYKPGQTAFFWLDEVEELQLMHAESEIGLEKNYEEFIEKCIKSIEGQDKDNYIFKIKRWSADMPFWCIFFCDRSNPEISVIKEQCGLALMETTKMPDLLSALADSGVFTKVSKRYFLRMDERKKNMY